MSDPSAAMTVCAACPWRTENHGKPHPHGWYTKRNRERLWSKLRRGDSMSCHPTDTENPVPEGARPVPEGTQVHECTGALILQQREFMIMSKLSPQEYKRLRPRGLTRVGLACVLERAVFGGIPMIGGAKMTRPDLNQPVSVEGLDWPGPWSDDEG